MKILLLNPPLTFNNKTNQSSGFKHLFNMVPPLGLAYISSYLRNKLDVKIKIIDCMLGISEKILKKQLLIYQPDIIGITTYTSTLSAVNMTCRFIKNNIKDCIVVLGGPHVSSSVFDGINEKYVDFIIKGEGEITFYELVNAVNNGKNISEINNICYISNNQVVENKFVNKIDNLDELPFPARDLLPPMIKYKPTIASYIHLPATTMITSRGCPFNCSFCDCSVFGRRYRQRSVKNVIMEIKELINKYKIKDIRFFDDSFAVDKNKVLRLCDKIKEEKLKFNWTCLMNTCNVDNEILNAMKSAGCWQVLFGLESGSDKILKALNKKATVESNRKALILAKKIGLSIRADFLIGTPLETEESINKTLQFALKNDIDFAHFNKFIPYPGTKIYTELITKGYKLTFNANWDMYSHNSNLYIPEDLKDIDLGKTLDRLYTRFYLRISYILKLLFRIKSFKQLTGYIKAFFSILKFI